VALGYSCAGVVVECGRSVDEFEPGDRVACGGGGYATHAGYNNVPRRLCVKIPEGVSFEDASFATVGAIALQAVRRADVRLGERVVVVGLGLIGLLAVQILRAGGCRVLGVDPDAGRCAMGRKLGAAEAVTAGGVEAALAFSEGQGVDAVLLAAATSSNQPIEDAAEMLRMRGRAVVVGVVGMNIPRESFYRKELDLRLSMSYGPGRYDRSYEEKGRDYPYGFVRWTEQRNLGCFLDLVASGRITPQPMISHRFAIDDGLGAYEVLERPSEASLAITISYDLGTEAAGPVDQELPRRVGLAAADDDGRIGFGLIGAGSFARGVLLSALR